VPMTNHTRPSCDAVLTLLSPYVPRVLDRTVVSNVGNTQRQASWRG
jgi:hypothetical protein